jgi:hypothetical protein
MRDGDKPFITLAPSRRARALVAPFAPALIATLQERDTTMDAPISTIAPAKDDAEILAAWGRRSVACAIYSGLPFTECPSEVYTPEEQEQVNIMDAAEAAIHEATATTPQGAAIQLWTALAHIEQDRTAEAAINIMDLDWFLIDETRFDWNVRLILAALRSLRAMGGAA